MKVNNKVRNESQLPIHDSCINAGVIHYITDFNTDFYTIKSTYKVNNKSVIKLSCPYMTPA